MKWLFRFCGLVDNKKVITGKINFFEKVIDVTRLDRLRNLNIVNKNVLRRTSLLSHSSTCNSYTTSQFVHGHLLHDSLRSSCTATYFVHRYYVRAILLNSRTATQFVCRGFVHGSWTATWFVRRQVLCTQTRRWYAAMYFVHRYLVCAPPHN